jgi:hypothetical protein
LPPLPASARLACLVRLGLVEPDLPGTTGYTAATALRLRKMLRLHVDLGANLIGAAIAVEEEARGHRRSDVHPRRRVPQGHRRCGRRPKELLSEKMPPDQAAALAEKLFTGTWTYDYAIMPEEAKSFGLPVSTDMPKAVYDFMNLFPQPTRTRPGVEYVPSPYGSRRQRDDSGSR